MSDETTENFIYTQLGKSSALDAPHHDVKARHVIEKVWGIPPVPANPDPIPKPGTSAIPARADHVHRGQFGIKARLNSVAPSYGPRPQINFIEGTGIDIAITDDSVTGELDISFGVTGDSISAVLARHNNILVGSHPNLNFLDTASAIFTIVSDTSAADETEISLNVNDEWLDDFLTLAFRQGIGVNIVHDEAVNTFTFSTNLQDFYNLLRLSLVGDFGINITNNDADKTLHFSFDDVDFYNILKLSLLPGSNITLAFNDAARQITINSSGGGGIGIFHRIFDFNQTVQFSTSDNLSIGATEIFPSTSYQLVAWGVRLMGNAGGTGVIVNVVKNNSTAGQPSASLTSGNLFFYSDTVPTNTGTPDTPSTAGTTWGIQVIPQSGSNLQGLTATLYFRPV